LGWITKEHLTHRVMSSAQGSDGTSVVFFPAILSMTAGEFDEFKTYFAQSFWMFIARVITVHAEGPA
jgi:hypothetical protein